MNTATLNNETNTASMVDTLWVLLKPLTKDVRHALAKRLLSDEDTLPDQPATHLTFPKLPKGWKPTQDVYDRVADRLHGEIDWDAEIDCMWEERAK